jgi:MYXO-CTERM domain-containing protein
MDPPVGGPFGGIAADPVLVNIPDSHVAVSDSIRFEVTLSETITMAQLQVIADGSRVEFGSDFQYLDVPAPGALALLGLAGLAVRRRRRG